MITLLIWVDRHSSPLKARTHDLYVWVVCTGL